MDERDPLRRARAFRFGGYWALAIICLLAIPAGRTPGQALTGWGFCLIWPWLVDQFVRRRPERAPPPGVVRRRAGRHPVLVVLHLLESAFTGMVLGWASVPPLAALAAAGGLLLGAAALGGLGLLAGVLAGAGSGAVLGALAAPRLSAESTLWADAASALLLLGFAVALADLCFRQARVMTEQRRALAQRTAELERSNRRLARYLPQSLRDRVAAHAQQGTWERRWLTVGFVDLVGFTDLVARTPPEQLRAVLADYLEGLGAALARHRGELSKLMGDGALVTFGLGARVSRREAARGCLALCAELPLLLQRLRARWHARGDLITLQVRVGVASGFCTLGDWGHEQRLEFTTIGAPVNLASRLQSEVEPGQVLMDAATANLAGPAFPLSGPCRRTLKGLGSVATYRLVDPAGASAMVPAPSPPASREI
ncbi:MAG: adenylate/guanylate cyclase domain-containing protein [Pseudomonadales bacterium]